MVKNLLVRGMLAGLVAGVLAFGFAKVVGETQVGKAISFEEQTTPAHAPGAPPEHELVSRTVQSTIGLGVGVLVIGIAVGGGFALAFAYALGRLGPFSARATALAVAAIGFGTAYVVPFLKYPPNPPAVGDPDTIDRRTALYWLMIAVSAGVSFLVARAVRPLVARLGAWNGRIAAGALYALLVAAAFLVMPGVDEVPAGFPASTLWRFRIASLGTQVVLWGALALVFGALAERIVAPDRDHGPVPV